MAPKPYLRIATHANREPLGTRPWLRWPVAAPIELQADPESKVDLHKLLMQQASRTFSGMRFPWCRALCSRAMSLIRGDVVEPWPQWRAATVKPTWYWRLPAFPELSHLGYEDLVTAVATLRGRFMWLNVRRQRMPSKPTLPQPHPWSVAEVAALKAAGAELRDTAAELEALAKAWLCPLLAARERFVLVLPPVAEEEHPIWLLVRRLLPTLKPRHVEKELAESAYSEPSEDKPLPPLQRYMQIPTDMSSSRKHQSFTSLTDLFDNPAVAVLKDAANLRGATLMAVEDERRLLGTLAHRLVEKLFAVPGVLGWAGPQVRAWFDTHGHVTTSRRTQTPRFRRGGARCRLRCSLQCCVRFHARGWPMLFCSSVKSLGRVGRWLAGSRTHTPSKLKPRSSQGRTGLKL